MKETIKVAVYGSLRKGLHNNDKMGNSKLLGTFESNPIFDMYDLGSYPGLKLQGNTPITFEVYEVSKEQLKVIDGLEGYNEGSDNHFYNRLKTNTPYGEAYIYTYVPSVHGKRKVTQGDWVDYYESAKVNSLIKN